MLNITLKQLRYFSALAKHRHFGKAADACAVTQPALSMQIKELEEALGCRLMEKGTRPVQLTKVAQRLLKHTHVILSDIDNMEEVARASKNKPISFLRLGVIPSIAPYFLPEVIKRLNAKFKDVELHIQESMSSNLIDAVNEGRLDIAIMALPVSDPNLVEAELFVEQFVLVRPVEDANEPIPNPEQLRHMRLLLLKEGHCFRDQALEFCKIGPSVSNELMDASSLSTLVQMVSAGMGVTLIPRMAVKMEKRAASISVVRFPKPEPFRRVGLIWRKKNYLHHLFVQIANVLR